MGINFNDVGAQMGQAVDNVEDKLATQIENFDAETASQADMIQMQMSMQKYTMATQLQSTVMKTINDALKSVIQNMR